MFPKLIDFALMLEEIAPERYAEEWDNPGLQVGSYSSVVKKVFLSLDPTLDAVIQAGQSGAQLLFTHHPLIFRPLKKLDLDSSSGEVIFEAFKRGVSILAAHTNLDAAPGGINDILAGLLELRDVEVLEERDGSTEAGLGRIGDLTAPVSIPSLVQKLKQVFTLDSVRIGGEEAQEVSRLAVVGGSGGSLVHAAANKGAQALITGDVGHHHALESGTLGIALIDCGHFVTEFTAFSLFAKRLNQEFASRGWQTKVESSKDEKDPLQVI